MTAIERVAATGLAVAFCVMAGAAVYGCLGMMRTIHACTETLEREATEIRARKAAEAERAERVAELRSELADLCEEFNVEYK